MQKQNHSKKTPQKTKLGFIVTLCCTNTIILKNMLTVVKKKPKTNLYCSLNCVMHVVFYKNIYL